MALSYQDLKELRPGALIRICVDLDYTSSIDVICTFNKIDDFRAASVQIDCQEIGSFWFDLDVEIFLVAPSMEALPLEDWAGLAHLLHPKLQKRVLEWFKI